MGGEYRRTLLSTGQHGQLTNDAPRNFSLRPDRSMHIMRPVQSLNPVMAAAMTGMDEVLVSERPDWVAPGRRHDHPGRSPVRLRQGNPAVHMEAGLKTGDQ
ncbi:UDP-N-acetylglucosamine 2-epimerase [Bifidobacterium favimelis]|uniref:UDP-N-acetylglucosamine 2-epimerase n=1 Tax=Bifidobacterium favimelis TaxID=3122979 RepID=A0ABU8ZLQ3_9BIFI